MSSLLYLLVLVLAGVFYTLAKRGDHNKVGERRGLVFLENLELQRQLFPGKDPIAGEREYREKKRRVSFLILLVGIFLGICVDFGSGVEKILEDGGRIERNRYGEGGKEEELVFTVPGLFQKEKIQITVNDRIYRKEEVDKLMKKGREELDRVILGNNKSKEKITQDLYFPETLMNGQLEVSYSLSRSDVFTYDGKYLQNYWGEEKDGTGGEKLEITILLTYLKGEKEENGEYKRGYQQEYTKNFLIFQKSQSQKESFESALKRELEQENIINGSEKYFTLPSTINGTKVYWEETKSYEGMGITVLSLVGGLGVYFNRNSHLKEESKKRKIQMLMDYPEIVGKIRILLGTGISLNKVVEKLVSDYAKEKGENGEKDEKRKRRRKKEEVRFAYEELILLNTQIMDGVGLDVAFREYGKRCGIKQYIKLSNILTQSLKKGAGGIFQILDLEIWEAYEEKRAQAKIRGEEAGTKLLFPMLIQLGLIIALIMIPIFMGFSGK